MDLNTILIALNSGIPSEALGGVIGAGILTTINKIKSYFGNKNKITKEELSELYETNDEFKKEVNEFYLNLENSNMIQQIGKKNVTINNNFGTLNF